MRTSDGSHSVIYKIIKSYVRFVYPRTELVGAENIPDGACIIVGNHCHTHGPIIAELYVPGSPQIWCAAEMMNIREVPDYAYYDFSWNEKPKWIRMLYRILSYIIAPICGYIFNHADTIGVYHDARILTTLKNTVRCLENDTPIVIFPESKKKYNDIVYQFQDGFVRTATLYYKRTGKRLQFVPMYLAPELRKVYFGTLITYEPAKSSAEEADRISCQLMDAISELAWSAPRHLVVPYPNKTRGEYLYNDRGESHCYEKTCR